MEDGFVVSVPKAKWIRFLDMISRYQRHFLLRQSWISGRILWDLEGVFGKIDINHKLFLFRFSGGLCKGFERFLMPLWSFMDKAAGAAHVCHPRVMMLSRPGDVPVMVTFSCP